MTQSFSPQFAQINGLKICYRSIGSGPALLVLHGIALSSKPFSEFALKLSKDFTVYIMDLKGHGDSDKPNDGHYHLQDHVDLVIGFLDYLKLSKVDILGISLGGLVALKLALLHPERVNHLITSSSPISSSYEINVVELRRQPLLIRLGNMRKTSKILFKFLSKPAIKFLSKPLFMPMNKLCITKDCYEMLIEDFIRTPWHVLYETLSICILREDMLSQIPGIKLPVLVVHGEEDQIIDLIQSQEIHSKIKGSELVILSDSGHAVWMHQPDKLVQLIIDFCESKAQAKTKVVKSDKHLATSQQPFVNEASA